MAKVELKEDWSIKPQPAGLQSRLDAMLVEAKSVMQVLDDLDIQIQKANNIQTFKDIAKLAVGNCNYLRKKCGKLSAAVKNAKSNRYLEIKLDCAQKGIKFVHSSAMEEAFAYASPLRLVRDIFESYVESATELISICRMNTNDQRQYQNTVATESPYSEED